MLYLQMLGEETGHPGVIYPEELDPLRRSGSHGDILPNLGSSVSRKINEDKVAGLSLWSA